MPKIDIVENGLIQYDKYVSIIILSLMSNMPLVGKIIAYMIWVLSIIWLMKSNWSNEVTIAPKGKVELWYGKEVQRSVKTMIL